MTALPIYRPDIATTPEIEAMLCRGSPVAIANSVGLRIQFTEPAALIERYKDLMDAKTARGV